MSNTDTTLEDSTTEDTTSVFTPPSTAEHTPGLADTAVAAILDLDELLSSARLVERTATICMRGDLEGELDQVLTELGDLVDEHGVPLDQDNDASLGDASRAAELQQRAAEITAQMRKAERQMVFRAMDSDAWAEFEKAHRKADGSVKDSRAYVTAILSICAVQPTLTLEQVAQLRGKVTSNQLDNMFRAAYGANTTGGLDVPKLPSYSHAPNLQERSLS